MPFEDQTRRDFGPQLLAEIIRNATRKCIAKRHAFETLANTGAAWNQGQRVGARIGLIANVIIAVMTFQKSIWIVVAATALAFYTRKAMGAGVFQGHANTAIETSIRRSAYRHAANRCLAWLSGKSATLPFLGVA